MPYGFAMVVRIKECIKLIDKVRRWLRNVERAKNTEVVM
jgi:hypothetical protein